MDPQSAQPTNPTSETQQVPSQQNGKKSKLVPILLVGLVLIILVVIGEVIYLILSGSDTTNNQQQTQTQTLPNQNQPGDPESQASRQNLPTKAPYSLPEFDEERAGDVNAILDAVLRYREDNNGKLPNGVTSTPQEISSTGLNICSDLIPQYINALPIDPVQNNKITEVTDCNQDYQTGYAISVSGENVLITIADKNSLDDIKAEQ